MRISSGMIWSSVLYSTNRALSDYYALAEQNSSTKKVNRPSDDPSGTGSILNLRDHLSQMEQQQENIDTARGWLTQADDALNSMSEQIISCEELCEQAATGTLDADQRIMVAEQVRELYSSMLAIANTEFAGDSIFAGQEIDSNAYEMGLGADVTGGTLTDADVLSVEGGADTSILVEFLTADTVGTGASGDIEYRYSDDGGDTWTTATLAAGDTTLDLGTAQVELADGATTSIEGDTDGASIFVVRPAACYLGDDADGADVAQYGASSVTSEAAGVFSSNVVVRIDTGGDLTTDTIEYSYSTDGGSTWVEGNTATDGVFTVPGGTLRLSPDGGSTVDASEQFVITPHVADISVQISDSGSVVVNNVGKDIFGGMYQASGDDNATAVDGANLFETVGELIGALETNDQEAIGECLDKLEEAHALVTAAAADVGARENRLDAAETALGIREFNESSYMSDLEDVDMISLSTELEAAQAIYLSVVETSTNIMQLSLLNYL